MLTEAVAVYLRELREGRGFIQESLADAVGVGKRTIERLERYEGDISVGPFQRIILVLGAAPDEVNYLATNPSATAEEAKELAQALLQRDPSLRWTTSRSVTHHQDAGLVGVQAYVRVLRERQGISRKALADIMGITIAALADWEAGRSDAIPPQALLRGWVFCD